MKKLCFLAISFFLVSAFPLTGFTQTPSAPRMVIEGKDFDFKEVMEGRVVEHTFKVLNKGNQPLEIQRVSPG